VEGEPASADSPGYAAIEPFRLHGGYVEGYSDTAKRIPAKGIHADYYGTEVDVYVYFSGEGVVRYRETRPRRGRATTLLERLRRIFKPGPEVERLDVGF
jgi:hypothetical protein